MYIYKYHSFWVFTYLPKHSLGFPGDCGGKGPTGQCRSHREVSAIPESGGSPGEGHGTPLWYSCLENPMDRGAWWATVHEVTKSWTQLKQLGVHTLCSHMEIYGCTMCKVFSYKSAHHILTVRPWGRQSKFYSFVFPSLSLSSQDPQ